MIKTVTLLSLLATASIAQAAFYVNAGSPSPTVGEGPLGADTNYLGYGTPHENPTSGQLTTYNAVSFAEGGLAGTYDVGVAFSWPDANDGGGTVDINDTKQSFSRSNVQGYDVFWQTWVGIDIRTENGGIGGGDRMTLSLTGLEANQAFTFTSYHADTQDQAGTFLVDQTPSASETSTSPFAFPSIDDDALATPWVTNAYSFDVTSDGLGNLDITFTQNSGTWIGINGFDLVAVPEPSSFALLGGLLALSAVAMKRRRA
ncbi:MULTISPECIES: PEP-CTERM sorting domain-containing protein [unclassified Lentimonas]|uniref:PEP-CTERM sorting domain-containing protein n=1 Tax=unclassified Lentimonas TaxID=2630993 RepID=UPI00132A9BEA|nr:MULTISPECIES: PEP-CTERM sorting domain-containing protein [unclassified Lentimonas]CAA6677679.1 Unannotated [Lentimonas sp. CC4]CAA6684943.1 Unannotated [Lentimonas sp. CC6]CAA7077945.1 Unannotated [Lentimonas sp. CC4]CAA7169866.1 Unannotated [Lentimonas sp. CC21]CAA7181478.1 Unannotated [Lentimonas sp. CC8]